MFIKPSITIYGDFKKLFTRARRACPFKITSMAFFVLNRIWHLPGLTFIWLLVNQEKSLLAVDCSYVITLDLLSAQQYGVVLSAKLAILESSHSKKRSIKSMLNSNGT